MKQPDKIGDLTTPALLLDWPVAKGNIDRAAAFVADRPVKLRPHFKNHKCVPLAKKQLAAGGCTGFTAATLNEAEILLKGGIDDVLLANQIVGQLKIERLLHLCKQGMLRVAIDDIDNARAIGAAAEQAECLVRVVVELDIGDSRCGIQPDNGVIAFVRELQTIGGLVFDGLHAYHGRAVTIVDAAERQLAATHTLKKAIATRRLLESSGISCSLLTGVGSSTYSFVADMDGLDEMQMGSYVTMDWSYKERAPDFNIALTVLATVISTASNQFVLDVGVKGVGAEYGPPRILNHPEFDIPRFSSEEHTIVKAPAHTLTVGEQVHIVPSHACATCNLHDRMVVHQGELVREIWPIDGRGY